MGIENPTFDTGKESEPYFMNNFYCYLPGGPYRRYYGGDDEEKTKIMDAFDKLVAEEFTDIELNQIVADKTKARELSSQVYGRPFDADLLPEVEEQRIMDEARALSKSVYDRIRPIFNRLIELGFKAYKLAQ